MENHNALIDLLGVGISGIFFIYVIACIIVAELTAMIAASKNYNRHVWGTSTLLASIFLTPLFGLLLLITCGFMGTAEKKPEKPKHNNPTAGFLNRHYVKPSNRG